MQKILIVDDDKAMLSFLQTALENAKFDVVTAADGMAAYHILEKDVQEKSIALILSDVVMPGMDGMELSEKSHAMRPDVKIILMSGFTGISFSDMTPNNAKQKKTPMLAKPFHLNDLIAQIKGALAE